MLSPSEEPLHDVWQASRAAWPGVEVAFEDFAAYVHDRIASPAELADLAITDLYLAAACALGVPGALETLDRALLVHVPRMVARLDASIGEEVRQALRTRLFVASGADGARIVGYRGRGSLLSFLRMVALRTGIDLLRARDARREVPFDEGVLDADALARGGGDPELDLIRARHRELFEAAVRDALSSLPARSRNLLRLHLCGGVSTRRLATMFVADQSTVVRWLASARAQVRDRTRALLTERLGLSTVELESLTGLLLSRLDLSLAGCLGASGAE